MNTLSIVIPVYNEIATIRQILGEVGKAHSSGLKKENIVVDDYSTDGTREILMEIPEGSDGIRVYFHDRNQGKGAALRTGINKTTGDIVLIQDADLEYDPNQYPKFLAPILMEKPMSSTARDSYAEGRRSTGKTDCAPSGVYLNSAKGAGGMRNEIRKSA